MKRKLITLLLCGFTMLAMSQVKQVNTKRLEISYDKTLHLVFDNNVKYIDCAQDIVAEKNEKLQNIVKVVVDTENYEGARGLSVITADGVFHSFEVVYKKNVQYSTYYDNKKDSAVTTDINVTTNISTHLIFPSRVIYSNVGNDSILMAEPISSSNILKIKAIKEDSITSNLFVVTEDKKCYEFFMNNKPSASTYTYNFCLTNDAAIFENTSNDKILETVAEKCLKQRKSIASVGERKNKLTCFLNNVHINNDVLYFTFEMINTSTLNMNIDFTKCFIKDKVTIKNSPEQEIEMTPILSYKYLNVIESNTDNTFVLAFPKFTIPDKKKFEVEIFDKDGGRHLTFTVKDDLIINAKPIL